MKTTFLLIMLVMETGVSGLLYASTGRSDVCGNDSLSPVLKITDRRGVRNIVRDSIFPVNLTEVLPEMNAELRDIELDYSKSGNNRKAFLRLMKVMRLKKRFSYRMAPQRLYTDLAKVSARLKLYPLAMQYYSRAVNLYPVSLGSNDVKNGSGDWQISDQYPALLSPIEVDTLSLSGNTDNEVESKDITANDILQSFDDGKADLACALILHIKQPVPGKRKAFAGLNNVGHMFVTLIKYNTDGTIVSRSFGFYPGERNSFFATPIHPASPSVIKDDVFHLWDEAVGKFITHRRLVKILRLLAKYEGKGYHLNYNNCTDFGLHVAKLSGIDIPDTKGFWPLGKGNNPASTGQSVLKGKVVNTDTGDKTGLFICSRKEYLSAGQ